MHGTGHCSQEFAETGVVCQEHDVKQDLKIESSCRMGRQEDGGGVDSEFRVYGVKGLRVCDASIFPWLPTESMVRNLSFFLLGHQVLIIDLQGEGICVIAAEKLAAHLNGEYDGL